MAWNTENIIGTELIVTGDNITQEMMGERALVILNHRTRLDWMFVLGFYLREGRLWNFRAIVKEQLKYMLPFGWPMQLAGFIFLARNWEIDQSYIEQVIGHLGRKQYPTQLLVFPEGTDKTENTSERSNVFAAKQGLPPMHYTLHPRRTGFMYLVERMRAFNNIDAVYDLTMAFRDRIPQSEKCFFTYDDKIGMPKEVHFHLKRHAIDALPEGEALGDWLQKTWTHKDARLARFYEKDFKFQQEDGEPVQHVSRNSAQQVSRWQQFGVLAWFSIIIVCLYLMVSSSWFFWYTVVGWFILQAFTYAYGFDKLEIFLHGNKSHF